MTPEQLQAIEERWNGKNMCVHPEALKQINALLAEVRRLRCCGNCKQFDLGHDGMHIEPQCKLTTYYLEPWHKCEKWEVAS